MEACRARSDLQELWRANFGRRRPSVLDAGAGQHCVTLKLDVDLWYWTPGRISTVSPFSLGAGAGQQCVALARHPGVVGRCPKKMKRTKRRNSSVGDPFPLPRGQWLWEGGVNKLFTRSQSDISQ